MRFSYPNGSTPLDGFTIKRGLGVGGFGEVYYAISTAGKKVALKKIQRNLDIELRGVKQCLNLKHVNLISLWDIRSDEHNESWVVMEYVPGPSLRDVVEAHPQGMPEEEVKRWFLSTASGVAYLHQKDIVHRDLKPGNIFLDEETQVIKIGDYGLSKFISTSRRSGQTESVGTFHYMAPEIGRGVYGKEIDIYALGIILFEVLTGDVPFDGESTQEIIMKHLTDMPNVDRVPAGFREVIRCALAKDPDERYHSVPEMLAAMPWPEVAENCQKIISHQAVGPIVAGVGKDREYSSSFRASPTKITNDHPASNLGSGLNPNPRLNPNPATQATGSQLPPSLLNHDEVQLVSTASAHSHFIGDDEIRFGPLKDTSQHGHTPTFAPHTAATPSQHLASSHTSPTAPRTRETANGSIQFVDSQYPSPTNAPITSQRGAVTAATAPIDEPIARVVHSGMSGIMQWWHNANTSTPLKLFLLTVASIVVVKNSEWLLPAAVGLGLIYLVYFAIRNWLSSPKDSNSEKGTSRAKPKQLSRREQKLLTQQQFRQSLQRKPVTDRATELLTSMLVAAFACSVFNLLGLAIGGSMLNATIESWAVYAWMTTTSIVASWLLLSLGKFWESRIGESVLRRLTMLGLGIVVGAVAFFSANLFRIDLSDASLFGFSVNPDSRFAIKGLPMLPAYLIFFTGLFGILRWWLQTDPVRATRLSLLSVSLCLIWASVFSHLLEVPMTPNCILAVVISISIQLAAPWLPASDRLSVLGEQKFSANRAVTS